MNYRLTFISFILLFAACSPNLSRFGNYVNNSVSELPEKKPTKKTKEQRQAETDPSCLLNFDHPVRYRVGGSIDAKFTSGASAFDSIIESSGSVLVFGKTNGKIFFKIERLSLDDGSIITEITHCYRASSFIKESRTSLNVKMKIKDLTFGDYMLSGDIDATFPFKDDYKSFYVPKISITNVDGSHDLMKNIASVNVVDFVGEYLSGNPDQVFKEEVKPASDEASQEGQPEDSSGSVDSKKVKPGTYYLQVPIKFAELAELNDQVDVIDIKLEIVEQDEGYGFRIGGDDFKLGTDTLPHGEVAYNPPDLKERNDKGEFFLEETALEQIFVNKEEYQKGLEEGNVNINISVLPPYWEKSNIIKKKLDDLNYTEDVTTIFTAAPKKNPDPSRRDIYFIVNIKFNTNDVREGVAKGDWALIFDVQDCNDSLEIFKVFPSFKCNSFFYNKDTVKISDRPLSS